MKFWHPAFELIQIGHKLEKWRWSHNLLTWSHCQLILTLPCFFVKFSCWSKLYVKIITCSGVMTIFVCKGLTRIRKSEITPSVLCTISEDRGKFWIPNLVGICLMKKYLMLPHARVHLLPFLIYKRKTSIG